jgi:hypothetical protein
LLSFLLLALKNTLVANSFILEGDSGESRLCLNNPDAPSHSSFWGSNLSLFFDFACWAAANEGPGGGLPLASCFLLLLSWAFNAPWAKLPMLDDLDMANEYLLNSCPKSVFTPTLWELTWDVLLPVECLREYIQSTDYKW